MGVMRRMTTVVVMVVRCRIDSVHVLTTDSAVTGALLRLFVPIFLGSVCSDVAMGGCRPLNSFDELLSMAVLTASRWMLLMAVLSLVLLLSGSSAMYCWMFGLYRPIIHRRRSGRSSGGLWQC